MYILSKIVEQTDNLHSSINMYLLSVCSSINASTHLRYETAEIFIPGDLCFCNINLIVHVA